MCLVPYQRTRPGVGEAAQPVPTHVENAQAFQAVHDGRGQAGQDVIGHVQLLQLTKTDPVGRCRMESKSKVTPAQRKHS